MHLKIQRYKMRIEQVWQTRPRIAAQKPHCKIVFSHLQEALLEKIISILIYHEIQDSMKGSGWNYSKIRILELQDHKIWQQEGTNKMGHISVYKISTYPPVRLSSESEFSESLSELSESLSELNSVGPPDLKACSNSEVNFCSKFGEQQKHCQLEACTLDKYSSPAFLFTQVTQNNILHDLQLTKSLLCPHQPQ